LAHAVPLRINLLPPGLSGNTHHAVSFMGRTVCQGSFGSMAPHHSPSRGQTTVSCVPSTQTYCFVTAKLSTSVWLWTSPSFSQAASCEYVLYAVVLVLDGSWGQKTWSKKTVNSQLKITKGSGAADEKPFVALPVPTLQLPRASLLNRPAVEVAKSGTSSASNKYLLCLR